MIEKRILKIIASFRQEKDGKHLHIAAVQGIDGLFQFNGERFDRPKLRLIAKICKADLEFIYHPTLVESPKVGLDYEEEMQKEPELREMSYFVNPALGFIEEIYV